MIYIYIEILAQTGILGKVSIFNGSLKALSKVFSKSVAPFYVC